MQRLARKVGEGETLEASGCPDLAKQTKREWPTFEKVFDGPLAERPTHEVCSVHPIGHRVVCHFPLHAATRHKNLLSQLRTQLPLLTSRVGSGHRTVLKSGLRIVGCFELFRFGAYRQSGPLKMLKLQKRPFPTCRFVTRSLMPSRAATSGNGQMHQAGASIGCVRSECLKKSYRWRLKELNLPRQGFFSWRTVCSQWITSSWPKPAWEAWEMDSHTLCLACRTV